MSASTRIKYWRRLFAAYLTNSTSQLSFWHDHPTAEQSIQRGSLDRYYMRFDMKAGYDQLLDSDGVPMLDYRGAIGPQYNPIAIAQFALGNHTLWRDTQDPKHLSKCVSASNWLVDNLKQNEHGRQVWFHNFDWEYVETLRNPWYSGLAQGQGISALLRCHTATGESKYLDAATQAFQSLRSHVDEGGTIYENGDDVWIEEYIVNPPSHILNGFIWALWGVYDYQLQTNDPSAQKLWLQCLGTLKRNLHSFDLGYWSLYDQSASGPLKMIASSFYHRLHIVQLSIMAQLTGDEFFSHYSESWTEYTESRVNQLRAKTSKAIFKLLHY